MNSDNFRSYIVREYSEDVARFICEELSFLVPITFTTMNNIQDLRIHINRREKRISDYSKSIFYFTNTNNEIEILPTSISVIDKIRQEISTMNKKQKKKCFGKKIVRDILNDLFYNFAFL